MSTGRACLELFRRAPGRRAPGWLAACALLAAACASRPPQVLAEREAPFGASLPQPEHGATLPQLYAFEYRVGPGDVLRVNVFGEPELSSGPYDSGVHGTPVDSVGRIMLPLVGGIDVQGRTLGDVADLTSASLRRYLKEPRVDVAVVRFGAHRFLVVGEVRVPGAYVMERPTTVMEALARSGGFGTYANRRQVAWVRGGIAADNVALFDASELDPLATQLLQPGDIIFVGRKRWADVAEAARDLLPILQLVATPVAIALQTIAVSKID